MVCVTKIHINPDEQSASLADLDRGREVIILEKTNGWQHVEANVTTERTVTGWVVDKGIVTASTPNGDKIIYGEAVDSEDQATRRHGRRGADKDAMRLYYRMYELFPQSPLAGEALYRAADIRWQLDKADVMAQPSAKEQEAYLREEINPEWMKEVKKKFPGTKWAWLADFHMIDNKLCGDWQGTSKCPDKEADIYEKYAKDNPQSPKVPEALYDAAWRRAALIEIYKTEEQAKKSEEARQQALNLAQQVATQFPDTDWGARALRLSYLINQGIPTYGNALPSNEGPQP